MELTEGKHRGEYCVSEANGSLSREAITLITGQDLEAGTVLGKITASGKYTQVAPAASDGSEAAEAILYDNVDASLADTQATITARLSEVNGNEIVWPDAITAPQKEAAIAELEANFIILR